MKYVAIIGTFSGVLLLIKFMLGRARTDSILSDLAKVNDQAKQQAYANEVARLEKEVADAKINYVRIRDQHKSSGPGSET